jgi:hypothetical protein
MVLSSEKRIRPPKLVHSTTSGDIGGGGGGASSSIMSNSSRGGRGYGEDILSLKCTPVNSSDIMKLEDEKSVSKDT